MVYVNTEEDEACCESKSCESGSKGDDTDDCACDVEIDFFSLGGDTRGGKDGLACGAGDVIEVGLSNGEGNEAEEEGRAAAAADEFDSATFSLRRPLATVELRGMRLTGKTREETVCRKILQSCQLM